MSQLTPRRAGLLGEGAEAVVTAQEGERAKTCTGNVLCTNELCACVVCLCVCVGKRSLARRGTVPCGSGGGARNGGRAAAPATQRCGSDQQPQPATGMITITYGWY